MHRLLVAVPFVLLGGVAHADCPVNKQVRVSVACTAEMTGMSGASYSMSDHTEPSALELGGKTARLSFGDYRLTGELTCSGKGGPMNWGFKVELNKKGKPSPVAYTLVSAADAARRQGGPALEVTSYHFFEPSIDHPQKPGQKLSRLDYTCRLQVD